MKTLLKNINILAIALPSLRIFPLSLIRIAAIVSLYAVALFFNVAYIQSIGSGIGNFSGLFQNTLILWDQQEQVFEWLSISLNGNLIHQVPLEIFLFSSLLPVKPAVVLTRCRLTNLEKEQIVLTDELKQILVGIILGFSIIIGFLLGFL